MSNDDFWPEAREAEQQPQWQQRQQPNQRQNGQTPPATEEEPPSLLFPSDRVYEPYETRMRPESLIFLTAKDPAHGAAYHHLQHYSFDQHHGQFLTLFYPGFRVDVKGQRLGPVIHAVLSYKCAIIREWHRDLYDPPTRGIPLIESITITPMGD